MITVFNLSRIYEQQNELIRRLRECGECDMHAFYDMEGINGYCSARSASVFSEFIRNLPDSGMRFLDNGNFHYISSFFLKYVKEPFDLVVFDHHTDMQPPGLIPCLSCGGWILESMKDRDAGRSLLRKVVIIGPPAESECSGAVLLDEEKANEYENIAGSAERLLCGDSSGDRLPVYISIDKDVLSDEEVKLNWDQGSMPFKTLKKWLKEISKRRRICALDICGEPMYNQFPDDNVRMSENINIELYKMFKETDLCRWTGSRFPA